MGARLRALAHERGRVGDLPALVLRYVASSEPESLFLRRKLPTVNRTRPAMMKANIISLERVSSSSMNSTPQAKLIVELRYCNMPTP